MSRLLSRYVLSVVVAALLTACVLRQPQDDMQPPIGAPGGIAQSRLIAAATDNASYKVLFTFGARCPRTRCPYGAYPEAPLVEAGGMLYGTALEGGRHGHGTVFSIAPGGPLIVLHGFRYGADGNRTDGGYPSARLIDVSDMLYGTTRRGGAYNGGTVFSITPTGKEKVLYSFGNGTDGIDPAAPLIELNGTFYGTTIHGGSGYCTVFTITPSGTEKVLYSFAGGTDGAYPSSPLVEVNGTLYGATGEGGGTGCSAGNGCGTVYSITLSGSEKVLYRFVTGTGGVNPSGGLIDVNGTLYGTTAFGGAVQKCGGGGCGTVYSITTAGSENVLHSFGNGHDGIGPYTGLIKVKGKLYGTTQNGGAYNRGTIFSVRR